jgi:effector-binding domain-containing protein
MDPLGDRRVTTDSKRSFSVLHSATHLQVVNPGATLLCPAHHTMVALQAAAAVAIKSTQGVRALAMRKVADNYAAQKDMWPTVFAAAQSVGVTPAGPIFSVFYDQGFKERGVDIEVCIPIDEGVVIPVNQLPEGVHVVEMPPAPRVAAITHVGSMATISADYGMLYAFIATEKLQPAGPVREVHLKMDPNDPTEGGNVTEIQQVVA